MSFETALAEKVLEGEETPLLFYDSLTETGLNAREKVESSGIPYRDMGPRVEERPALLIGTTTFEGYAEIVGFLHTYQEAG
jgi:hypothetical protein